MSVAAILALYLLVTGCSGSNLTMPFAGTYGEDTHLVCTEPGFNISKAHGFSWKKMGLVIYTQSGGTAQNSKYSHVDIQEGIELVIHDTSLGDAGVYSCMLRLQDSMDKVLYVEAPAKPTNSECSIDQGQLVITMTQLYPLKPLMYVMCSNGSKVNETASQTVVAGTIVQSTQNTNSADLYDISWKSDDEMMEEVYVCKIKVATVSLSTVSMICNTTVPDVTPKEESAGGLGTGAIAAIVSSSVVIVLVVVGIVVYCVRKK